MLKDLWSYTKQCFWLSCKPAWRGADNLIGNTLSALISLALAQYLTPWIQSRFQEEDVQALITGTIGVIVFLICFFVLRLIFVAPFQLYRRQRKEVETLQSNLQEKQKQLDDLVNGNTPDLPFGDAIALVGELFPGRGYSDEENASQIVKMLFREKISAWGQPPLLASMVPLATTPIKIPHEFFYSPNYGPTENDGYSFEVFTSLPGWEDWRDHEQYLNVMVNRGQVIAAFSNKSPM